MEGNKLTNPLFLVSVTLMGTSPEVQGTISRNLGTSLTGDQSGS